MSKLTAKEIAEGRMVLAVILFCALLVVASTYLD
jgi:hypothetical protein